MKKTLILAFAAFSLSAVNAVASNELKLNVQSLVTSNPILRVGTVVELTENGGKLMDQSTGELRDFYHPGAHVDFKVGDSISYIIITFPNGKPPIVTEIKKPS